MDWQGAVLSVYARRPLAAKKYMEYIGGKKVKKGGCLRNFGVFLRFCEGVGCIIFTNQV